jgi:hypothetical protein
MRTVKAQVLLLQQAQHILRMERSLGNCVDILVQGWRIHYWKSSRLVRLCTPDLFNLIKAANAQFRRPRSLPARTYTAGKAPPGTAASQQYYLEISDSTGVDDSTGNFEIITAATSTFINTVKV